MDWKKKFRLDKAAFMTEIGEETVLTAVNGRAARWYTDNAAVAAVDADGRVTAVGDGDTVVTAEAENGEKAECTVSVGYHGQNPLLPPTWGLFIADGEPHVFNGRMYIYGSRDNAFGLDREGRYEFCSSDYHVIYSDDLLHWTDAGVSVSSYDIPEELPVDGKPFHFLWAPDAFKAPGEEKYYLTFCVPGGNCFLIAESSSPCGPFENIRRITHKGEDIHAIDPGVLVDDDDRVYIAIPNPFRLGELDPATGYSTIVEDSIVDVSHLTQRSPDGYRNIEGPSLRRVNGKYYFIYIASRTDEMLPVRMNYLISEDIRSGWRFGGTIVDTEPYLVGINVHGSMEVFNGRHYLAHHRVVPGIHDFVTREMSMEEIRIREDGTIEQAEMTSSGVKGAFVCGETVHASLAVWFSGGRGDDRFTHRGTEEPQGSHRWHFAGYPYVWFDRAGQYNGYRYLDLRGGKTVTAAVRTTAPGAVLTFRDPQTQAVIAALDVPDTQGGWMELSAAVCPAFTAEKERYGLTVTLDAVPAEGKVELDWFRFDA